MKPICYDLYAGLGGWAEGLMAITPYYQHAQLQVFDFGEVR